MYKSNLIGWLIRSLDD